jgi:hypothetical protein
MLNICTVIFHCIYRKIIINSRNKVDFTKISLYFLFQWHIFEDNIKAEFTSIFTYFLPINSLLRWVLMLVNGVNFSVSETRHKLQYTSLQFYSKELFLAHFRQAVCFINFVSLLTSSETNHQ